MEKPIHINFDLGEGLALEQEIITCIDSCNIACGGHYGDFTTVDEAMKLAIKHQVKVGAHPSFADLSGFGRRELSYPYDMLVKTISDQLRLFVYVAEANNCTINHVKPHGALYNLAMHSEFHADAILEAMKIMNLSCPVYASSDFFRERAFAQKGPPVVNVAYGDIRYIADRSSFVIDEKELVITEEGEVWQQIQQIQSGKGIESMDGETLHIEADSFSIQNENPNAINILKFISDQK